MQKVLSLLLIFVLIFSFAACEAEEQKTTTKELFVEFLESKLPTDGMNFKTEHFSLRKDDIKVEIEKRDWEYRIIATMSWYGVNGEQFFDVSLQELKMEMNLFAEHFISFAKEQEFDNDYYLYINIDDIDFGFVYDYETDTLYYPKHYKKLLEMYEKFNSVNDLEVAKTEKGKKWLVENNFGELKHHEYESNHKFSPTVYIDEKGEFSSFSLDEYC